MENAKVYIELNATDPNDDPLVYTITGGEDKGLFVVDPGTGILQSTETMDFESPKDHNGDNIYELELAVSDNTFTDRLYLQIIILDEDEDKVFELEFIEPNPTSSEMAIAWEKTWGGSGNEEVLQVLETMDGNLILAGNSSSTEGEDKNSTHPGVWLVKISETGDKIWEKTYWCEGGASFRSIIELEDGGLVIGTSSSANASGLKSEDSKGQSDFWVLRTDENGTKIWDKTIGSPNGDWLADLKLLTNGNILLLGSSTGDGGGDKSTGTSSGQPWLVCINPDGQKIWNRNIPALKGASHIITSEEKIYIYGQQTGYNYPYKKYLDVALVEIDAEGNGLYYNNWGGSSNDYSRKAIFQADDGFYLVGKSGSYTYEYTTLIKLDPNKEQEWIRELPYFYSYMDFTLGDDDPRFNRHHEKDFIYDLVHTGDGVLMVGNSRSMGETYSNAWMVKVAQSEVFSQYEWETESKSVATFGWKTYSKPWDILHFEA